MALKKNKQEETTFTVKVTRAKQIKNDVAFDMEVNGIMIYGCWLKETKAGKNFVSFPSYKGSDGKYYSHAFFRISDELEADIEAQLEKLV